MVQYDIDERERIDEALITAVSEAGDVNAFQLLFERYAPVVQGFARKMVNEDALAEEVVQETFWRVWRNAAQYNPDMASFATWMFNIARNLCIDMLRRQRRAPVQSLQEEEEQGRPLADEMDVVATTAAMLQHEHVQNALQELPPDQQDIILWVYFQGKTRRQIAQETGIPFGTINTRARLALEKLRRHLQPYGFEEAE